MAGILENQVLIQETGSVDLDKNVSRSRHDQFDQWVLGEAKNDVVLTTDESDDEDEDSGFVEGCSDDSLSSSDMADDATSSSAPMFELSQLMTHLPLKRGLSKYYEGKSESFGSLANLNRIQDLAKKGSSSHWSRRLKCRGYGSGQSQRLSPKGRIVKSKKSCSSSIARTCVVSSLGEMSSFLDTIVVQNHF